MPTYGTWTEIFNSDDERYGGSGVINTLPAEASIEPWNGREQSIVVRVPPLGGMILKCTKPKKKKVATKTSASRKKTSKKATGTAKKSGDTATSAKKSSSSKNKHKK